MGCNNKASFNFCLVHIYWVISAVWLLYKYKLCPVTVDFHFPVNSCSLLNIFHLHKHKHRKDNRNRVSIWLFIFWTKQQKMLFYSRKAKCGQRLQQQI